MSEQEFNQIKQTVNLEILKLMEAMGIEIAGASTDIKVIANSQAAMEGE